MDVDLALQIFQTFFFLVGILSLWLLYTRYNDEAVERREKIKKFDKKYQKIVDKVKRKKVAVDYLLGRESGVKRGFLFFHPLSNGKNDYFSKEFVFLFHNIIQSDPSVMILIYVKLFYFDVKRTLLGFSDIKAKKIKGMWLGDTLFAGKDSFLSKREGNWILEITNLNGNKTIHKFELGVIEKSFPKNQSNKGNVIRFRGEKVYEVTKKAAKKIHFCKNFVEGKYGDSKKNENGEYVITEEFSKQCLKELPELSNHISQNGTDFIIHSYWIQLNELVFRELIGFLFLFHSVKNGQSETPRKMIMFFYFRNDGVFVFGLKSFDFYPFTTDKSLIGFNCFRIGKYNFYVNKNGKVSFKNNQREHSSLHQLKRLKKLY